jgi:Tfp pilus assembly protein PilP
MRKLNKKQILILVVMLLAVLYGAYAFFSTGRKGQAVVDTAKKAADLNAFIGDITVALTKDTPSPVDAYMIQKAEAAWLRDPFYERKIDKELPRQEKPISPLQQYKWDQFKLIGIIGDAIHRTAMVVDPKGQSYPLSIGNVIGMNNGIIVSITDNQVTIEELNQVKPGKVTKDRHILRIREE